MYKYDFLLRLEESLAGLPREDIDERLEFYSEMIDDRMEDGLSEEEAVLAIGKVEDVVSKILEDIPVRKLVREKVRTKRKLALWEIVLIILGSPLWLPLLAAAAAVVVAIYCVLWSVVVSLWAVFASFAGSAVGSLFAGGVVSAVENVPAGVALIGASFVCAGISVFLFFGCKAATKGAVILTKKIVLGIKRSFIRKECAK